jgi:hypothetical protein
MIFSRLRLWSHGVNNAPFSSAQTLTNNDQDIFLQDTFPLPFSSGLRDTDGDSAYA